ncbi:MAG: hypothetical protein P8R01_12140, partial [Gammaproteobacteria bacterium]|nr:hypothetical protein [Gammaproteobacteria bacterium]
MNLKKLNKFLRPLALRVFRAALILATGLLLGSCSSLIKPSFNRMSEAELIAYNLTVASPEQVTCMQVQIGRNQDSDKICGTLVEIQRSIEPVLPGAKINALRFFYPIEAEKSRSTNPP